ncbi:DNA adenine methylase [Luteimonas notoginsengisoli]|uniref:site-specific DNA-methyltransferase (adenine-specific) n=1 Tax=Luteimonas notoginsengisoli TaxID=1578200 RepID=A0ABV7UV26_9GAMM
MLHNLNQGGAFASPLRYPGGKGRMGPWLATLMRANGLTGGCYIEPYAGGAGAALFLLLQGYAGRIVINDADPAIFAFWDCVVNRTEVFIRRIARTTPTMEARSHAKQVLERTEHYEPLDVAFSTFLLNRTNRSGILNGGVIGGKAQAGTYKLDARYNKENLIARIRSIGALREKIQVYGMDALEFFERIGSRLPPKKSLIYLDPPYYVKGSQLYRNCYQHDDHVAVSEVVKSLTRPVLVTYDDALEIRKMYGGMSWTLFNLKYSTHLNRPLAKEILIYRNLALPMPPALTRGARLMRDPRVAA